MRLYLFLAAALVLGCATLQSPADAQRDAIHAAHSACQERVEAKAYAFRAYDGMALTWCDVDEERACARAGLERHCGEWNLRAGE